MKGLIIFLLFFIQFFSFSHELGPIVNHKLAPLSGDLGYGVKMSLGTGGTTYVWRQYGEDVNFTINNVSLMELGSDRGTRQGDIRTIGEPLEISAPNDINIKVRNENIRNVQGSGFQRLEVRRSGDNALGASILLGNTNGLQLARVSGDLVINIPWSVNDGTYTFLSRFSGQIRVTANNGGHGTFSTSRSSPVNNFDLITYLQVAIQSELDFGKVVFVRGASSVKKVGDINISGSRGKNIKVSLLESKVLMKRNGGNETVPLFLKLINGGTSGSEMDLSLDSTGRKNIQYEARIEPGLYPDIPEGKYSGVARFQVKYN